MDARRLSFSLRVRGGLVALLVLTVVSALAAEQSLADDPVPAVKADYTYSPGPPTLGVPVTFTSVSQVIGVDNVITKYEWDLDGTTDNGFEVNTGTTPSATTTYTTRGPVNVRLRVTDSYGDRNTKNKTVTVVGNAPAASFTLSPPVPTAGQPVLFTFTGGDSDGTISDVAWDLNGDGLYDNGGGPTALRSFDLPGSFVVGVRATDNEGAVSFYSQAVSIAPAALPPTGPIVTNARVFRLLSPFPVVRIAGKISRRGARVSLLAIDAPPGSTVVVRCRGRGCPFRSQSRAVTAGGPQANTARQIRLRRLERLLRSGTKVRIYVIGRAAIGKYTSFKIRKHRAPRRNDMCLPPSSRQPVPCPAA